MAVLCGMSTRQYSGRSARLSVRLSKWACPTITSGRSNCIATVNGWFNRIRQVASMCPSMRHTSATWRIPLNLCILRPTRVHNPNGKSIGSALFAQLTAESAYTLQWAPLSTRIAPSHGGSGPPSNMIPWAHGRPKPNGTSIGSAVFAQVTAECPYTLQWFARFSLKTSTQTATRSLQPFLQGSLVWLTDIPTDRRQCYSIGNNRPYVAVVSAVAWLVLSTVLYHYFLYCYPTNKDDDDDDERERGQRQRNGRIVWLRRTDDHSKQNEQRKDGCTE